MNTCTKNFAALLLACAAIGAHADALRDPTQPPLAPAAKAAVAATPMLRVSAIFRRGSQLSAIVDGKLVRAGDRIGTAIIQDITSDAVRYSRNGRSEVSRLKSSTVNVRRSNAVVEEQT